MSLSGYGTEYSGHQIWSEMANETQEVAEKLLRTLEILLKKRGSDTVT